MKRRRVGWDSLFERFDYVEHSVDDAVGDSLAICSHCLAKSIDTRMTMLAEEAVEIRSATSTELSAEVT